MMPIKTGFFSMEVVHQILAQTDLVDAKKVALASISALTNATPQSYQKAQSMVEKSQSVIKLGISVSNFILAHPSENLRIIQLDRR